jgi:hypothetical protein
LTLVDVDVYREAELGEFVRLTNVQAGGRSVAGIELTVGDVPKTYALPAGGGAGSAAAVNGLARKLKAGNFVYFVAREEAADATPVVRDMRLDYRMGATAENASELVTTFCRIQFWTGTSDTYAYFYPGSSRKDDQVLERGVRSIVRNTTEQARLKLDALQVSQLQNALELRVEANGREVPQGVKDQWVKIYKAWMGAGDDAERLRIEQQMGWAAQELSRQWRAEVETKYIAMRTTLKGDQLEEVMKLGKRLTPGGVD